MTSDAAHSHSSEQVQRFIVERQVARESGANSGLLKKTRRKLWDLPSSLYCPIIGTCLGVDELRKLARNARCQHEAPVSDYDVHVSFVSSAGERNALSLAAQKALEKKHASHVRRFANARSTEQLAVLWRDALACGEVPGGFWATLTHPKCDETLLNRAREEVHMLSHQIGAGQRADLKRLAQTQSELAELKGDLDALYKRSRLQLDDRKHRILELEAGLREIEEEHRRLAAEHRDQRRQLAAVAASCPREHIAKLERQATNHGRRLRLVMQERNHWRQACEASERRAASLDGRYQEKLAECSALERLITQSRAACDGCAGASCADCPNLRGRLILCVGGRSRLIDHYRALVARCNGRFDHHDGGVEDSRQRLEAMLSSADAVVCATDCVSHDAYYRLKRFCKHHDKPHVLLRSSGISTFARALEAVAE